MNCKPGDLAVFVRSAHPENIGKIVQVLRAAGKTTWWIRCMSVVCRRYSDCPAGADCVVRDADLRPIRPDAGEDETLQWAPVPGQKVEVPA